MCVTHSLRLKDKSIKNNYNLLMDTQGKTI